MKDYFAAILIDDVTGVTKSNLCSKSYETTTVDDQSVVTLRESLRGSEGNQLDKIFHPVTLSKSNKVTKEDWENELLHSQPPIAPKNEDLHYFYHERAALMEFDGELSRSEAERTAYQEALTLFLIADHPEILEQFESIIQQSLLN